MKPWQSQESRGRGWKGSEALQLNPSVSWGHSAECKSGKKMCWEGHFSSIPQPVEPTDPTWCWTVKGRGENKTWGGIVFQNTHRTGRGGEGWPCSSLQIGDPHVPPALLVTDELLREGEAAGHLQWHHSTAGTSSGQE